MHTATDVLLSGAEAAIRQLELSPQSMTLAAELGQRISNSTGAALVVDYGRNRAYETSLQAIRQHSFVGLLEQPGSADLSAHVDFSALRWVLPPKWVRGWLQCSPGTHFVVRHTAAQTSVHSWTSVCSGGVVSLLGGCLRLCKDTLKLQCCQVPTLILGEGFLVASSFPAGCYLAPLEAIGARLRDCSLGRR